MATQQLNKAAFSIDLEDWYQGIEKPFADWPSYETRIEKGFYAIFNLLQKHNTKATWFTLGWVAEKYPHLIKELHAAGHELASHTYSHEKVYKQTRDEFREEIKKTKQLIENITGKEIVAHRSPFFSITNKSLWALDILKEEGYTIDCSISPIKTWRYGISTCPDKIFSIKENGLIEFPVSRFKFLKKNWAIGGAYFRIFPYYFTAMGMRNRGKENLPNMFYIHPWEYDAQHPKVPMEWKAKTTHYFNLSKTISNTDKLLNEFKFDTVSNIIEQYAKHNTIEQISIDVLQD